MQILSKESISYQQATVPKQEVKGYLKINFHSFDLQGAPYSSAHAFTSLNFFQTLPTNMNNFSTSRLNRR